MRELLEQSFAGGWRYTVAGGKRLRRGFTTGSCAAAAAKAAVAMLFSRKPLQEVQIETPCGVVLNLPLEEVEIGTGYACCAVRKDAGDDPDITDGILLVARAMETVRPGFELKAGRGVGRVTKPGLQMAVGEAAINPVPRRMIQEAVCSVLPPGAGVEVELSIPDGEKLAAKTMNPRLGIVGGLSILGTSGLVEPMSDRACMSALALEFQALRAEHRGPVVLVTGNYGRAVALEQLQLPAKAVIKVGNLIGYALDRCREQGFKRIILIGHLGKLIKVAAGIFNTHSRVADARFEAFAARAALLGAGKEVIFQLRERVTTEEMAEILEELGGKGYFNLLAEEISSRAQNYLYGEAEVGAVLFNFRRGLLGLDSRAEKIMEEFR